MVAFFEFVFWDVPCPVCPIPNRCWSASLVDQLVGEVGEKERG